MKYDFLKIEKPSSIEDIGYLLKREVSFDPEVIAVVSSIIEDVRKNGDKALLSYCRKYEGQNVTSIGDILVSKQEISSAAKKVAEMYPELVKALDVAYENLMQYHRAQFEREPESWYIVPKNGKKLGQIMSCIERAGMYIPGGRYIYPSSVLMTFIPAHVAGVREIAVFTPPQKDGSINEVLLYLFSRLGISEVYKAGGAQAIAALAYGTETIKKVEKIAGPGNIYVTVAKKLVYGITGIDSLAGPSEVLIIADKSAKPAFIAADLLSQSEHDPDARSILLSNDMQIASDTISQVYLQIEKLQGMYGSDFNREVTVSALEKNCRIIFNPEIDFLIKLSNAIAPEHLEIAVSDPEAVLKDIRNAGAIFLGNYTPVAVGDYICGTNHVIPTGGNARFSSPLGVYDFCKKSSVAFYDRDMLAAERKYIECISGYENLVAHNNSIKVRFKDEAPDKKVVK